jgi:hypothetical protein
MDMSEKSNWRISNFKPIGKGSVVGSFSVEPSPHLKKRLTGWILSELKKLEPVEPDQPGHEVFANSDGNIPF